MFVFVLRCESVAIIKFRKHFLQIYLIGEFIWESHLLKTLKRCLYIQLVEKRECLHAKWVVTQKHESILTESFASFFSFASFLFGLLLYMLVFFFPFRLNSLVFFFHFRLERWWKTWERRKKESAYLQEVKIGFFVFYLNKKIQ